MRRSRSIPFAILLGGVIIAGALYLTFVRPQTNVMRPALIRPVSAADHILGNPAAPIKIVAYLDFDSAFSRDFYRTLRQVTADRGVTGQVAFVFREFPLTELHPNAFSHARAAECVAEAEGNDTFWKFADKLFDSQPVDPLQYGALAASAGVSDATFASCYANAAKLVDARINADQQNALDIGAEGAPYSLIVAGSAPPIAMGGAYPYDAVQALLDQALEGSL